MARITVVGVRPGPTSCLTKQVESEPLRAEKVFFRTGAHPAYEWLFVARQCTPFLGAPNVLEATTNLIRVRGAKEGVEVKVLPGVSFLDQVPAEINFDFSLAYR
jgi:uncharacterized protein YabN with tetrapyrrole methylase and pyrophosphatase domain